ncbi:AsmA family protein [Methylocapsa acidiphila]|uniref:AsmA family protein n=1 Tax=Methylocapsa acidiphila TaxID=133552 RepID=UPI0018DBA655|nr:AsmA family protein [Methylocapsa acidiphila]
MAPLAPLSSRPSRKRAARAIGAIAVIFVLVGFVAAMVPWAFSTEALRGEIMSQIRQMTGLAPISQGPAVFVVLPQPHISIEDVSLSDPSGALRIQARALKGYFRVTSLLRGQLEIGWASLTQPELAIDLDGTPMPSDSAIGRAAAAKSASPQAATADQARLAAVTLIDGRARLKSRFSASEIVIDGVNVAIDWRKLGGPARVTGQARFQDETTGIAARIESPVDLLRGGRSAVSLGVMSNSLNLSADGVLASEPGASFSGHIVASSPSLRKLLQWGGFFIPFPDLLTDFALACEARLDETGAACSELKLRLDDNEFEGALALQARDKTPALLGTLATNRLSARPFIVDLPRAVGPDGEWSRESFDLDDLRRLDLDLRVSAARILLPNAQIEDAAFAVLNRDGRLEFSLAEAKAYQGVLKGRASLSAGPDGVSLRARGSLSDLDMAALPFSAFAGGKIIGALTAHTSIESSGSDMRELMRNIDGDAQISVEKGGLVGIDLGQALRRIDKMPLALPSDIRRGGTAFDRAAFGLRIAKGVAEIEAGALNGPGVDLQFGGAADIGGRALELSAVAMPSDAEGGASRQGPQFRFQVAGSWDDLTFLPDVRGLISHSDAAAPLLAPRAAAKPARNAPPSAD